MLRVSHSCAKSDALSVALKRITELHSALRQEGGVWTINRVINETGATANSAYQARFLHCNSKGSTLSWIDVKLANESAGS